MATGRFLADDIPSADAAWLLEVGIRGIQPVGQRLDGARSSESLRRPNLPDRASHRQRSHLWWVAAGQFGDFST